MKSDFKSSFLRDIKKVTDKDLLSQIDSIISCVEAAKTIREIDGIKKLVGYKSAYRIRIGDYRIGLDITAGTVTFVRFLNRRDIYKMFP